MNIEIREIKEGMVICPYLSSVLGGEVNGYSCVGCEYNRNTVSTFIELRMTDGMNARVTCFYSTALALSRGVYPTEKTDVSEHMPIPKTQRCCI